MNADNPPLGTERVWNSIHHAWSATIARTLNRRLLPENYFAAPNLQFGPWVEIDVGAFEQVETPEQEALPTASTLMAQPATAVIPAIFPDIIEVVISRQEGGPQIKTQGDDRMGHREVCGSTQILLQAMGA